MVIIKTGEEVGVGDLVRLNSGGPVMTIVEEDVLDRFSGDHSDNPTRGLRCEWINDNGYDQIGVFPPICLSHASLAV